MLKKNSKVKKDNFYNIFELQTYSRNSNIGNQNKYNTSKTTELNHLFLKKNNYINPFKYDKLYLYENRKNNSTDIKKRKKKKMMINLKQINKFHKLLMHDKIQSFTDSKDYNDLTLNNKMNSESEFVPINLSKNFNHNKTIILKSSYLQNYKKEVGNMRNNVNQALFKKNITLDKTKSNFLLTKDIETPKNGSLYKKVIKKENINSIEVKKPIKILNYKFKNLFGNPNDNIYTEGQICSYRYQNNTLTEQLKNKIKLNLINKIQKDYLLTEGEKLTKPINEYQHFEVFQNQNKNYFLLFEHLLKKYLGYLYSNVENEKQKLFLLKEEKKNLKEEIIHITKKINSQKEERMFLQNLIKLLIKIRYNIDSLDKIPNEYLKKYGIMKYTGNIKNENKNIKKRNSMLITELKDNILLKYLRKSGYVNINQNNEKMNNSKLKKIINRRTIILNTDDFQLNNISYKSKSPKKRNRDEYQIIPKIPVFSSVHELDAKMKGIIYNLKEQFQELSSKKYINRKLMNELNRIKSEFMSDDNIKLSDSFIKSDYEEAKILKEKYDLYSNAKNYLISSKDDYIEYDQKVNKNNDMNKEEKSKYNLSEKLISIILKLNINIESILKIDGIYKFLTSPQDKKIIYNYEEYNKTIFCVKILETIFWYLIEEKEKYLSNEKFREKYLELQAEIDKNKRIQKLRESIENENKKKYKKAKELFLKHNKLMILPIKKDDQFSSNISRNKTIKKLKKEKIIAEKKDRINLVVENEILF